MMGSWPASEEVATDAAFPFLTVIWIWIVERVSVRVLEQFFRQIIDLGSAHRLLTLEEQELGVSV